VKEKYLPLSIKLLLVHRLKIKNYHDGEII